MEASLLLLLEPVLNPIWAWIVHGERPGAWSLAGGAILLLATTVEDLGRHKAYPFAFSSLTTIWTCWSGSSISGMLPAPRWPPPP